MSRATPITKIEVDFLVRIHDEAKGLYGWGVDGLGRCHVCDKKSSEVLFCALPSIGGTTALFTYYLHSSGQASKAPYYLTNG